MVVTKFSSTGSWNLRRLLFDRFNHKSDALFEDRQTAPWVNSTQNAISITVVSLVFKISKTNPPPSPTHQLKCLHLHVSTPKTLPEGPS